MIIYAVKKDGKIVSWSTLKMSEDEIETELSDEEFQKLLSTTDDKPMPGTEIK
jgi:hypothetical protein